MVNGEMGSEMLEWGLGMGSDQNRFQLFNQSFFKQTAKHQWELNVECLNGHICYNWGLIFLSVCEWCLKAIFLLFFYPK